MTENNRARPEGLGLGLSFLKYISDGFGEKREQLLFGFSDPKSESFIKDESQCAGAAENPVATGVPISDLAGFAVVATSSPDRRSALRFMGSFDLQQWTRSGGMNPEGMPMDSKRPRMAQASSPDALNRWQIFSGSSEGRV